MLIYDRGLAFGTCAGEASAWPLGALAVALVLAGATYGLTRLPALRALWVVSPILLGVGLVTAAILAASLLAPITARLEVAGAELSRTTCRWGAPERDSFPVEGLQARFRLREQAKGPPTPLIELSAADGREVASIWAGHEGLNLDALASLAPGAVAQYRRWRERTP